MRSLLRNALWSGALASGVIRYTPAARQDTTHGERDLIKLARKGDRVAFDSLVEANKDAVRRFLIRKVSPSDVDDLFQETWLAAWQNFKTYSGNSRFRTWLLAICNHKVQDHWRQTGRISAKIASTESTDSVSYLQDEFAHIELQSMVRQAFGQLTETQQELLDLYYGSELTLAEISKLLNRNLNTVKYQFYKAHEAVSAALVSEDIGLNSIGLERQ